MRRAIEITALLMALFASGDALAQSIVIGPGGAGVYDDRPRPPPPPYYDRPDYGPPPGYGRPPGYGPPPEYGPRPGYGGGGYGGGGGGGQVCAQEGGYCSFPGVANVRYGARGRYVSRQARGGIPCNNQVFGDPAPGVFKRCIID